ncbi:cell wall protein DAN4 [Monomorium pharaonis]|uniref:cell wall protein DAN4 n=1 Tax=Monomorium pharaonis TaxID=307658 RepID=UPI00063F6CF7|nr:cell wall protein DAN4 [Monomorium pharaonis]
MKRSSTYLALLIGIVIFLVGIEILLIYIACTTEANQNNTFKYQVLNKTGTRAPTNPTTSVTTTASKTPTEKTTESSSTTTLSIKSSVTNVPSVVTNATIAPETITQESITPIPSTSKTSSLSTETNETTTMSSTTSIATTPSITSTTLATNSITTAASETTVTKKSSTSSITTTPPPTLSSSTLSSTRQTKCTTISSDSTDTYPSRITIPKFNYHLKDNKTGVTCVLANMTIGIYLPQLKFAVPTNATLTGSCNKKPVDLTLSWKDTDKNPINSNKENKITFNYDHSNDTFFLNSIFVEVFINGKSRRGDTMDRRLRLFSAALKNGIFICKTNTTINVEKGINVVISDIYLIVLDECFNNCTRIATTCNIETGIKIMAIAGIIIVGLVLFIILFVLYLMWHVKKESVSKDTKSL